MTNVILHPVKVGMFSDDGGLSPQFICKRSNNNGNIILDSRNRELGQPPNNFTIGSASGIGNVTFGYKYKRLAFSKISILYNTPNVNQTNNVLQFNVGGTIYTATIPEKQYTFAQLGTALQTALNSAGSPATFTVVQNTNNTYTINSTVAYFFITTSPMIKYGISLIALSQSQVPSISSTTGSVMLLYSKSIYITSSALSQYTLNPSYFSGKGQMMFLASYDLTDNDYVTGVGVAPNVSISSDTAYPPRWINYESSQTLSSIDIQILDDYGNLFYIPNYSSDPESVSPNPSQIVIKLLTEI